MNPTPKLMLHFDLNKTLVLKDTSKGMNEEAMIISLLAEFTFAEWDAVHGRMSYKDYVSKILAPGDKARRDEYIGQFIERLRMTRHPLLDDVLKRQETLRQKNSGGIFSSFYALVRELKRIHVPCVFLLRTFGNDLQEVVDALAAHPDGIQVTRKVSFKNGQLHEGDKVISKTEEIFATFLQSEENFACQDSWKEWDSDGGRARSGKPFPFDASGRWNNIQNLSLFFDDNYTGGEKDIVRPLEISGQDRHDTFIFTVNPIEAMVDDEYYVKLVKRSLEVAGFVP